MKQRPGFQASPAPGQGDALDRLILRSGVLDTWDIYLSMTAVVCPRNHLDGVDGPDRAPLRGVGARLLGGLVRHIRLPRGAG